MAHDSKYYKEAANSWVNAQTFTEVSAKELIEDAREKYSKLKNGPKRPAWVFDLDSTLFCTAARNQKVFWKFLQKRENFPKHWALMWQQMGAHRQQYSIPKTFYSIMRDFGWSHENAEHEARAIWSEYQNHWLKEFFASRNISHDPAYEGAANFVNALKNIGYEIVYLTGRDANRGTEGTLHALKMGKFPLGNACHLRLKPFEEMGDLEFKEKASRRLKAEFEVEALIENEPENLVMFADIFRFAKIIFFHSIMSPRIPGAEMSEHLGERPLLRLNSFEI